MVQIVSKCFGSAEAEWSCHVKITCSHKSSHLFKIITVFEYDSNHSDRCRRYTFGLYWQSVYLVENYRGIDIFSSWGFSLGHLEENNYAACAVYCGRLWLWQNWEGLKTWAYTLFTWQHMTQFLYPKIFCNYRATSRSLTVISSAEHRAQGSGMQTHRMKESSSGRRS